MNRCIAILAVLVLALFALDRTLTKARERERVGRNRVARLLDDGERALLEEAPAILVERTGEGPQRYAPAEGYWRALDHHLAPADAEALQALVETFARAEGILATREVDQASAYGINTAETIRVSLLDPSSLRNPAPNALVAFDVGKSLPGKESAFVRKRGTKEVWSIDGDPRALLERTGGPGLPPLLEPGVVPQAWKGWQTGLLSVRVERDDGAYELVRRDLDPTSGRVKPGQPPWVWVLVSGESEVELPLERAEAYVDYLRRIPYARVLERGRRAELVPDPPVSRVLLAAREGETFALHVSKQTELGIYVWADGSSTLFMIELEHSVLLAPEPALLRTEGEDNPWIRPSDG